MIVIVNYGLGNLGSIQNMLKRVGIRDVTISSEAETILRADKLILPGVGAFDIGMERIHQSGLLDTLHICALQQRKPILGICLGMQLLTNGSEEGKLNGLGWIDAYTVRFAFTDNLQHLKVPHMSWNEVTIRRAHALVQNLPDATRFYFVHSYYVKCQNPENELISCKYGIDFTCGIQSDNIMGVQFHPEKSHKFGMQLLKNFSEL